MVPSQSEYPQSSEARMLLAGNQWSRKLETMASPACRSESGRTLQNRRGCTPGDSGLLSMRASLTAISSGDGQAEGAADRVREIDHQLAVICGHRDRVPVQRPRGRAGDVLAVAGILRAVAGAGEPVGEPERGALDHAHP